MPETQDRPLLGLDVDGVIALVDPVAVAADVRRVSAYGRWTREIRVPRDAAAKLAHLAATFDIVWVTAWGHTAHAALREVLELPERPWPFLPVQFGQARALAAYAGDRSWALVNDGVSGDLTGDRGTVVVVDPHRGIDDVHVRALQRLGQPGRPGRSLTTDLVTTVDTSGDDVHPLLNQTRRRREEPR